MLSNEVTHLVCVMKEETAKGSMGRFEWYEGNDN